MSKIGTHNSATGEKGRGVLSFLMSPFSKTQVKSVEEQWVCGCRYFDFRVRYINGVLILCHGLWESSKDLSSILDVIGKHASKSDVTYIMVTYEGTLDVGVRDIFIKHVRDIASKHEAITLTEINVKKPKWENLYKAKGTPNYTQGYKVLDGSSWHTYLPIPFIWNKVFPTKELNNKVFTFVDFL